MEDTTLSDHDTTEGAPLSRSGLSPSLQSKIVKELAKWFSTDNAALQLAKDAGIDQRYIPAFDEPFLFWCDVCEKAEAGMLNLGMKEICREAVKIYKYNELFQLGAAVEPTKKRPAAKLASVIQCLGRPMMRDWSSKAITGGSFTLVLAGATLLASTTGWKEAAECTSVLPSTSALPNAPILSKTSVPPRTAAQTSDGSAPTPPVAKPALSEDNMLFLVGSGSVYRYLSSLTLPDGSRLLSPPGSDNSNITRHDGLSIITLDIGSSAGLEALEGTSKSAFRQNLNNVPIVTLSAREPTVQDLPDFENQNRFFAVRIDADDDVLELGISNSENPRLAMPASASKCWDSRSEAMSPKELISCIDSCIEPTTAHGRGRGVEAGCWIFRTGDGSATWNLYTEVFRATWPSLGRKGTADEWIKRVVKADRISTDDISRGLPDEAVYAGPWISLGSQLLHDTARTECKGQRQGIDWLTIEGHFVKKHYLVGRFQPCKTRRCSIGARECEFLGLVETALQSKLDREVDWFPGMDGRCEAKTKTGSGTIQYYPDIH